MATRAVKVQLLGINPDGELFMTGFCGVGTDADNINGQVAGIMGIVNSTWTDQNMDEVTATDFRITGVRLARFVIATGVFEDVAEAPLDLSGTIANALPSQVALVCSLGTDLPGRSGRGRMYYGGYGSNQCQATGIAQPGAVTNTLNFTYSVMNQLSTLDEPLTPSVYSPTLRQTTAINYLRVGNAFDTQRRRANRRTESYNGTAFP
jgi:hypothetical protein